MAAPTRIPEDDDRSAPPRRFPIGRTLGVLAALAMAGFWIWILSGAPSRTNPDRVDDRDWAARAEATCAASRDRLDALPPARDAATADDRARIVDRGTDELAAMVETLAADLPADTGDAANVQRWLADYRRYLDARRDYSARLRSDPDAQLLYPERFGDPLDRVIDVFAEDVNELESCGTPGDIG
jgi:hypothetical protein